MKRLITLTIAIGMFLATVIAASSAELEIIKINPYEEVLSWKGDELSVYPINYDHDSNKLIPSSNLLSYRFAEEVVFKVDSEQKMRILDKNFNLRYDIETSYPIKQIGDIRESLEWGSNADGWNNDTVTSNKEMIVVNGAFCYKDDYVVVGEGLTKRTIYNGCAYYPEGSNKTMKLINPYRGLVNFYGDYDPTYRNMTVGLIACYDLDDGTDYLGGYPLGNNNSVTFTTGKVGDAAEFTQDSSKFLYNFSFGTGELDGLYALTVAYWVESDDATGDRSIMRGDLSNNGLQVRWDEDSGGTIRVTTENDPGAKNDVESASGVLNTSWSHQVYTWNASYRSGTPEIWINGANTTLSVSDSDTKPLYDNDYFSIGLGEKTAWDGLIDQVMFWSVQLNSSDIEAIYNSGSGVSCADLQGGGGNASNATDANDPPTVHLVAPTNTTYYNTTDVNLTGYANDEDNATVEWKFYVDGALVNTNSSLANNTNYTYEHSTGAFGSYCYNASAYDGNTTVGSSEICFSLVNDTSPPTGGGNDSGLVAHWDLQNSTGVDVAEINHLDATSEGDTTVISGVVGNAAEFNGSAFYAMGDITEMDGLTNMSISLWFKTNNNFSSGDAMLFGKSKSEHNFRVYIDTNNKIKFLFNTGVDTIFSDNTYIDDTWRHVVVLRNGSTMEMWIDGVKQSDTGTDPNAIGNTADQLSIGAAVDGAANKNSYYVGGLDEIYLYNKTLSEEEILSLYNVGQNFSVSVYSSYNGSAVNNITVVVNGTTFQNETGNTVMTGYDRSYGYEFNITINALGHAQNAYYDYNTSNDLTAYVFPDDILNITFYYEDDLSLANDTTVIAEFISTNYSTSKNTTTGYMNVSLAFPVTYQVRYREDGGIVRTYTFTMVDDQYNNLSLYLPQDNIENVTINVVDQYGDPVVGASISIQKYFVSLNAYQLVTITETNFEGQSLVAMELYTEFYKFLVSFGGELLLTTDPSYLISDEITLQIVIGEEVGEDIDFYQAITKSLSYNNATNNFRLTYNDPNGIGTYVCLAVTNKTLLGVNYMGSSCSSSSSATLLFNIPEANNTIYEAIATYRNNDGKMVYLDSYLLTVGGGADAPPDLSTEGLFIQILLTIAVVLVAIWSPPMAFILTPLSLVVGGVIGLHDMPFEVTVPLLVVGFILAFYTARKT
jgi:hypothetical protein